MSGMVSPDIFFRQPEDGAAAPAFLLEAALDFCLALVDSLQQIHARGERYGVMCLANIRRQADGTLMLATDSGTPPTLPLAYIAPEQTGRMNRKVDLRSDLYSLGVVMYALCCARLPFASENHMELVHSHIARRPAAPRTFNPALPEVLSALIEKLLEKNAEHRYQSAAGVAADLQRCRRALAEYGAVPAFALAEQDHSERLHITEKLYGREAEVATLLQAFERSAHGSAALLLVSGYAGIGKSSLVNEIHQPVMARRGYFASGKFEQFQRNIPYSAIYHALSELIRQILTEDDARITEWRRALAQALGPNGQMVIDVVPELAFLIGPQPPAPKSAASVTSYSYVMQRFVGVFTRPDHPLVLFLDDLQWADVASLKLLALLLTDLEHPSLLVIGAYRDDDVGPGSALPDTIETIRKSASVQHIKLAALQQDSITALIMDSFRISKAKALPLAELVFRKTMGNPFFVGQFLKSLHNDGLLALRHHAWQWNIADIDALGITDNVVDLLTKELARLPEETRSMLAQAACIGTRFEQTMLAAISQVDLPEAGQRLAHAVARGLIRPLDAGLGGARAGTLSYAFLHDRVQQAAYEGIDAARHAAVHLQIGYFLLEAIPSAQHEERIFDIVPQLNQGRALLTTTQDRDLLAGLNLLAAKRARESAALDVHREFVALAEEFGAVAEWRIKPDFMHALTMEKVSAAFARGDYSAMAELCRLASDKSTSLQQDIAARNMLLRCYGSSFRPVEMMAAAIEMMRLVGLPPPKDLGPRHVWWARLRLKLALRGRDPLTLADFPEPRDPQYQMQLIATTAFLGFGFGFYKDSAVIQWLSLELIRKSIRHGVSPLSAYAYAVWGNTLAGKYNRPLEGYKFAKVGALLGARGSMITLSTVSLFEGTVRHRRDAMRLSLQPLVDTYQRATERGDRTGAVVALQYADAMRFHSGAALDSVLLHMRRDITIARRMDYPAIVGMMLPMAMTSARLRGESVVDLAGGLELESFALQRAKLGDLWSVFYVRAVQCISDYYFGETESAVAHAGDALALPGFHFGTPHTAYLMFFSSLARLELVRRQGAPAGQVIAQVGRLQRQLAQWAEHAPMNYLHKWQLVEAELALARQRESRALELFALAIEGAARNDFPGDEALANELLARHLQSKGKSMLARSHMEEAHAKYLAWGALAKVLHLEATYPELLKRSIDSRKSLCAASGGNSQLDIDTIITVSQTLSGEIQLDRLLQKLMQVLIENAGAQKGVLLLQKAGALQVQASYAGSATGNGVIEVLQGTPVEQQNGICLGVINYVRRTRERLVLGDAQIDLRFNADAHVRGAGVRSVLCIPLHKQGELVGIFYLENNLAADAFTPAHTELLQVLSTQIAISLDNAGLYLELEQLVALRTDVISQRNEALKLTLSSLQQTQKQLVESEKLASLGQLVAGVAHEINTPIGIAVTGASTLAEHTATLMALHETGAMRRSDMEKYVHNAATISKLLLSNMERAATLIQSFKAVAVDQTSEERRAFRLRDYIQDVLRNLSPMLRKTLHSITLECDAAIVIDTYPGALAQILTNLVTNALLHGLGQRERGAMAIVVREPDERMIELRFSDDGQGIPEENLAKIFEPFFTTMRGRGGSGLGLNIVYNLVTGRLQGQIRVDSQVGSGTSFLIRFPRQPSESAHAQ